MQETIANFIDISIVQSHILELTDARTYALLMKSEKKEIFSKPFFYKQRNF